MRRRWFENLGLKGIAFFVALIIWMAAFWMQKTEIYKEVALEVSAAKPMIIVGELPPRIVFRLVGPTSLLKSIARQKEDPYHILVNESRPGIYTYRFNSENWNVPFGVKVLSVTPSTIRVEVASPMPSP